jgi:hypothetical protein
MPGTLSSAIEHHRAGRLDEAETAFLEMTTRDPANAGALACLADVLEQLGRPVEAREAYRRAVTLAPESADLHLRLGRVSLLLGDYNAGWRGYEWRTHGQDTSGLSLAFPPPRWDGSDPAGRTILVHCEPDIRDSIQFARYLPLLSGRGADVVLVCPRPLVRLFGSLPGVCVVAEGDPPPRADAWVPIGSLPLLFGTTPATIPTFAAYLRADARLAAAWRDRLRPLRAGGRKLVGLSFAGDPDEAGGGLRAIDREQFAPLIELPGVSFVDLHAAATSGPPAGASVLNFTPYVHDVADDACLAAQLDLIIADGSTHVAHLAGALGRRCWTLVPFAPDWRWALTGHDSSWYPSVRMFRQPARGDWASVVEELTRAVKQELALSPAPLAA